MVQVRLRWQLFPLRWRTVIVSENPAPSPMLQADNGFTSERRVLLGERFPATISLFELTPARAGSSIKRRGRLAGRPQSGSQQGKTYSAALAAFPSPAGATATS